MMKIVRVSGWRLRWWKQALVIEQPDTLLRWYRDLFRRLWKQVQVKGAWWQTIVAQENRGPDQANGKR